METPRLSLRSGAILPAFLLIVGSVLPAAAADLPSPVAGDVHESYHLLSQTYYRKVESQSFFDAARNALLDEVKKHGARVTIPEIHLTGNDEEGALTSLDASIAEVAAATHAAPTDIAYVAISGMARSVGDRYTQFMSPDDFRAFNNALDPERISGIGVLIEPDATTSFIRAYYVVPGTPADKQGMHAGDLIESVDGTSTKGLSTEGASKLLRGKAGSIVRVSVARPGGEPRDYAIARSEIQPPTVVYKMLPGDVGYIYVIAFGRATPGEFDVALARVKEAGAKALVLDLRNDGGGYVDSALEISSRFIAHRALVTVQERGAPETTIDAEDDVRINVPVTVLVNQYTASASEITAGALQDDGIAMLLGTKTFGKGVMQSLTPLPDGAAIKITTAHYLTPRRRDINLRGIDPDVRVDENHDARFGDVERDAQLRAALTLLQKKIAGQSVAGRF